MKNFNLIKRLFMDSHEKQSPQRFGRYAAMLIMLLTLGVGQMWANDTSVTFYYAVDATTAGSSCNDVKFCIKYGGGDGEWTAWTSMTKQDKTQGGKLVYKATYTFPYDGYYNWQFIVGSTTYEWYAGSWNSTLHNGQIYVQGSGWTTYSPDDSYTVYFVNTNDWTAANVKAYAWNNNGGSACDYNASWAGSVMTSTGKSLGGHTIYKLDFNKRYSNIIFSNNGSSQTSDLTLGTTNAGKMYDNGTWKTYQFDISLDQQSGSGGTSSVTGVVDSAMPGSKTAPTRTGYTFGGYYTSTGGGGTCYYNASMVSQQTVSASTPNTLYAKWTKKTYTVTVNNDGHGTTSPSGAQSSIAQVDGIAISADADDNYEFVNWTIESGTGSFTDATDASTTFYPTSAATIQANFRSTLTYSLTVAAGSNVGTVTGSTDPITLGNSYAITASNFTSGYEFNNWTADPVANASFASSTSASTNVTVSNGSVTVTANAREIMRNITISGGTVYGGAATSTTAGVATSAKITANAPATGKKFTGWSLGTGVSLKGGYNLTDRTIEIYSTANATVTAQYADRAGVKVYFAKPSGWSTAYVYAWKSSDDSKKNATWPGEAMASTETINYITYYTYQYYTEADGIGGAATGNSEWDYIKFTDNGDDTKRTADLAISNGHYYFSSSAESGTGKATAPTSAWCIKGDWNSWSEDADQITHSAAATGSKSITLPSSAQEFKVYNIVNETWWRFSGNVTATKSATTMDNSDGNMTITPSVAGPYTFALASLTGTPTLAITYPTSYTLTYSIGSVAGTDGSISTSPTTASGSKVLSGNTVTLTGPAAKTGYTWKGWYTNAGGTTGHIEDTDRAITVTMNADKTLYACYTENTYNTTIAVSPSATGTTSPAAGANKPISQVTGTSVTATPADHYAFYYWGVSGGGLTVTDANANPGTFKATSTGGTITAYFVKQWALKGSGTEMGAWETFNDMDYTETANTYRVSLTLAARTTYDFKIVNRRTNEYWGKSSTTFTRGGTTSASSLVNTTGDTYNLHITTDAAGSYTFTYNTSTKTITIGFPTAYTITFGKGTGGATITATGSASGTLTSGNYVASGEDVTFTQTATSTGYTFIGWYDAATGGSTVSGMSTSDNVLDNVTANKTVYSRYTPNNYTVTFDATTNGGTCATGSKSVTYDAAYGELPVATHASRTFIGWYTTANDDSETGTLVTAETIVSTASNHTLYARFESTYEVTVQFKCGSDVLYRSTTVYASATALAAAISAPDILGYQFSSWTGSNATFGDASSATTTVNASAMTTITANYTAKDVVYFKNNLGWEDVYVTFNAYTKTVSGKEVPANNGRPYYKMNRLGTSDIYYCNIPDTYTSSSYAGWAWNIAFDNTGYDYAAVEADPNHYGTYDPFYEGEFLMRGDFDPKATMYIPYNGDTETRNSGTYYNTGCWMKYNSTASGYAVKMNTYVNGAHADTLTVNLTADVAGGFEFTATVNLKHPNYTYGFKLYKDYQKNNSDLYYSNGGEIWPSTTTLPWDFSTKVDDAAVTADSKRCGLHTEALGDYKITVSFGTGKPMVNVEYPVSVGDWKLVYKDLATWSNGAHTASWSHPSRVIKAKANAEDIVSFYVAASAQSPSIELHKCTAIDAGTGAETWTKQSNVTLGVTTAGIYNYKVTQNASKVASVAYDGSYTGNYYIRTDVSDGGWSNYKTSGTNTMTYSEYSETHGGDFGPYSHYFMRFVNKGQNIKFCIANDYSECISDTVVSDSYTNEWIEAYGNVRFMWYHGTNKIGRAYISGSSNIADRFLVLEGDDKLYDENGTALTTGQGRVSGLEEYEMNFIDDQNWIYETTVQAQPTERIKLTAKYNNKIQYFYGAEGARTDLTTELLIGGSGTDKYKVRVVYDFKTNRLIKAFIPENAISTDLEIDADLMIIREHQGNAQQVTFNAGGALSKVKTVYGAMRFNKWTVNNKSKEEGHETLALSRYERDLFYISFPFDVELRDAFGFGEYGKHWIIEYYDGKGRAEKGFWADSPSNWKFITPSRRNSGFTLKAFEGYILALDLDEMTESSSVWNNGVENVYIYFPSSAEVKDIDATNRLVTIDQEGYECTINRATPDGDRRVKDSYWHVIGVPSFANYSRDLHVTDGGATIDWRSSSMPFLYEWIPASNTLSITTSATFSFKPTFAYMVQYSGATIYWDQVNVTPAAAPRRNPAYRGEYEFRLELQQNAEKVDQAYVKLSDDEHVTTGFEFNYDLSKEFNKNKANIYTMVSSILEGDVTVTEVAGNVLPLTEQTTVVPVGVQIKTNGEYTFSMPDGTYGVSITLIDNETGLRTPLGLTDYTVSLEAGTYDERFALEIAPIKGTATDIEDVQSDNVQSTKARKVMIDDILYIVKDGKVFDARGNRVR